MKFLKVFTILIFAFPAIAYAEILSGSQFLSGKQIKAKRLNIEDFYGNINITKGKAGYINLKILGSKPDVNKVEIDVSGSDVKILSRHTSRISLEISMDPMTELDLDLYSGNLTIENIANYTKLNLSSTNALINKVSGSLDCVIYGKANLQIKDVTGGEQVYTLRESGHVFIERGTVDKLEVSGYEHSRFRSEAKIKTALIYSIFGNARAEFSYIPGTHVTQKHLSQDGLVTINMVLQKPS